MIHVNITIYGKVTKVGYRFLAMQNAMELGVTGYVKNIRKGELLIEAEGTEEKVQEFIQWCRSGPPYSKINQISIEKAPVKNFTTFDILP